MSAHRSGRLSYDQAVAARGCEYCADDQNMYFGHVLQVGSSEASGKLLLRCPHCGWLYEAAPRGPRDATPISAAEAAARFPE
jgi:hypothetical protein